MMHYGTVLPSISRRRALKMVGGGFGTLGLAGVLQPRTAAASETGNPLAPKTPHLPPRAKHVIFLFLNGGLSQVDSFDPKPALDRYDGQPFPGGTLRTERKTGNLMRSPFQAKRYGKSGIELTNMFPRLAELADELCLVRSLHTEVPNHEPSLFMMNCGTNQPGRPSLGSWLTYGLGSGNQNLPGFVVLCPGFPVVGPPLWNSTFLPAVYQGTYISSKETDPDKLIAYLRNGRISLPDQRLQLDLVAKLNRLHTIREQDDDAQLEASIQSLEIAYRMQTEAPEIFDLSKETLTTRERYGESEFGRACLMALRLVEHGVRMVQVYHGNQQPWDSHTDIMDQGKLGAQADGPITALLADLKSRGLLDETLVICGSEFGRTPVVETGAKAGIQNGRDHNPFGFTMLLAGGGVKGGMTYGATDEFGFKAAQDPVHVHDLHATILHLMGIDHEKLTYPYSGRNFRLTDIEGRVIRDIIA